MTVADFIPPIALALLTGVGYFTAARAHKRLMAGKLSTPKPTRETNYSEPKRPKPLAITIATHPTGKAFVFGRHFGAVKFNGDVEVKGSESAQQP